MENERIRILIVEDDEDDFYIARRLLEQAKTIRCEVTWADAYERGLEAITTNTFDAALVDYRLDARSGLDLLTDANAQGCITPIILLTGQGDLDVDLMAMSAGAADYLVKGQIDAQLLERSIRYAIERKRAERRIREQATLLDKARDAISAYDLEGRVTYWNKSAERLTGWNAEEILGRTVNGWLYREGDARLDEARQRVLETGEWMGELRQRTRDGKEVIVESRWTLVRGPARQPQTILVINTDITERKQLEAQFLQAQRMESVGRLVSGIAHDLGNLLLPILLGVKVLQKRISDPRLERTIAMIQKSAERGSDMVKHVLAFARGVQSDRVPLAVADVIDEVEKIIGEVLPSNIQVEVDVPESLPAVLADATQLQQVLMNLCVNARDAMPDGGRLVIAASEATIDERKARLHLDARPGAFVKITVADTGSGIPASEVDKIFEPFFTTKTDGEGTGLGLSTVYTIIKSHKGFVTVDSEEGAGTTFSVYLPMADVDDGSADDLDGDRRGHGECVLVVDDEAHILDVTKEILDDAGYRVVLAANGREGLERIEATPDIVAVITDLVMPEVDGVAMIQALRSRGVTVPIIATSGLGGDRPQRALDAGANRFLPKPYTADRLCTVVFEALQEARSSVA